MYKSFLILGALNSLPNLALADFTEEKADCAFFEDADLKGAVWTSLVPAKDPYSAELNTWWQNKASSLWIHEGYVFEGYSEPNFRGEPLVLDANNSAGTPVAGGFSFDLSALNFNDQLSSFRCRPEGELKSLHKGNLAWIEGASYSWLSGGNHPSHINLKTRTEHGELIVSLHADNTYGINRQDYRFNLSKNAVHIDLVNSGFAKAQLDFDLTMGAMRPEFKALVLEAISSLQVLAEGYSNYPGSIEPPKPEVLELSEYLSAYTR